MRVFTAYINCLIAFLATGTGFGYFLAVVLQGELEAVHYWIFGISYGAMCFGVTIGFHRYGVHKSLAFTGIGKWTVRPFFLLSASCAVQNCMAFWCWAHKTHHADADGAIDPHSPNWPPGSLIQKIWQFLWAQMLWIPHFHSSCQKKYQWKPTDWFEGLISNNFFYLVIVLCPPVVIGLTTGWLGLVAYLAAVFLFWHMTGLVNSLGHTVGSRPQETGDRSTNIWFLAWLVGGELLHNRHHGDQGSARFARLWYEYIVDLGWQVIWVMKTLRLVHKVRVAKA